MHFGCCRCSMWGMRNFNITPASNLDLQKCLCMFDVRGSQFELKLNALNLRISSHSVGYVNLFHQTFFFSSGFEGWIYFKAIAIKCTKNVVYANSNSNTLPNIWNEIHILPFSHWYYCHCHCRCHLPLTWTLLNIIVDVCDATLDQYTFVHCIDLWVPTRRPKIHG